MFIQKIIEVQLINIFQFDVNINNFKWFKVVEKVNLILGVVKFVDIKFFFVEKSEYRFD